MAYADWFVTGLEKVILPFQEIQLARSKHCTNKISNEIKVHYAVYSDDEEHSRVSFTILEKQMTQIYTAAYFSCENALWSFLQNKTNYDPTKPCNPLSTSFARSVREKDCLWSLLYRPCYFVARSKYKNTPNTYSYSLYCNNFKKFKKESLIIFGAFPPDVTVS